MTEVTFVKSKNINNNACSFDGDWFYTHNEYEKCSYKSDEKAKMLYTLSENILFIEFIGKNIVL